MANHAKVEEKRSSHVGAIIAALIAVLIAACAAIVVIRPPFAEGILQQLGLAPGAVSSSSQSAASAARQDDTARSKDVDALVVTNDAQPTAEEQALIDAYEKSLRQTPLIARYDDLGLHSPIRAGDLTGILFHQASYEYAFVLETELPDADYETAESRSMRINHDQDNTGDEWLDAEALHLWRTADNTELDTSIDVGALAGTMVVSPVDGTVVLIKDYMLYDELADIEIHIQPDGHPDLDVVLIHTTDPLVKAGDRVEAGVTPISHVRNIDDYLTDVQLGFFTPEGVGGNHTHLQVNDATYPGYRENKLEGAYKLRNENQGS